ncbi:SDR family NAD(P)-dependent oxidoreductase [bacterium]|nr:SDR family NAD(P)-dependent oxidoreductase [bacterium]
MLKNKKIILTGVSRGIGRETAKLLLEKGVRLLGISRDKERMAVTAALLEEKGDFQGLVLDVCNPDAAQAAASWVEENWGSLDVLINNAGVMTYTLHPKEDTLEIMEKTMWTNLYSPQQMIRTLLPWLEKGQEPRIINVSSGAGTKKAVQTEKDMISYRLSKYALNGLTMMWATALQGKVAVNSLDPGWLKTDMGGSNAPGEPVDGAVRILELLAKPFGETGKTWYGAEEQKF